MINRILHTGTVALCALMLTGCPKDFSSSDEFDEDVQSIDGVSNQDRDIYRGRVMNGQLENALVWLDQGQDGAISSEIESSDEPLPADPWTVTDEEGRFELDVTGFQRDLTEGADWDPRDASVMVIAVPGFTIDHTSGETVDQAYFMMAPPGLDPAIVTPFTTMAETVRRLAGTEERGAGIRESGKDINERLGDTAEFVGVYKDYLSDSDARRMPFYAQALARTIKKQIPETLSNALSDFGVEDPIDPDRDQVLFEPEMLEVIGSILLDQASAVLAEVDADIDARGIEGYSLPPVDQIDSIDDFGPDLADPLLLRTKTTYLRPEDSDDFEASSAEAPEHLAAVETYDYDLATALRRADFQGNAQPSMEAVARLTNLVGRIHEGGAQWGLDLALGEQQPAEDNAERDAGQAPTISDRFLFSWSGTQVAELQSPRLNATHDEIEGFDDDEVDRLYRADREPGGEWPIENLVREEMLGGPRDFELNSIEYRNGTFEQTILTNEDTVERQYSDIGEDNQCDDLNTDNPRLVNARRQIEILDGDSDRVATEWVYGHYRSDPDDDMPAFRPLVRETVPEDNDSDIVRWDYIYFDDVSSLDPDDDGVKEEDLFLDPAQPDLIHSVQIADDAGELDFDSDFCNNQEESEQSRAEIDELDAFIRFEYTRFTDYLNEIGTAD